jgi:uncharacterized membrane protein YhaH (DUF805 family)
MGWASLFFSAEGRIGRRAFWIAWLVLAVTSTPLKLFGPLGAALSLGWIYPQVCVYSKRLHDLGQSGWKILLPVGLLVGAAVLGGAAEALGDSPMMLMTAIPGAGLALASVVISLRVTLRKGDPDANAYGPPPASLFGAGATPTPV